MFDFQVLQFISLAFMSVLQSGKIDFSSVVGDLKPLCLKALPSTPVFSLPNAAVATCWLVLDFYNFSSHIQNDFFMSASMPMSSRLSHPISISVAKSIRSLVENLPG